MSTGINSETPGPNYISMPPEILLVFLASTADGADSCARTRFRSLQSLLAATAVSNGPATDEYIARRLASAAVWWERDHAD